MNTKVAGRTASERAKASIGTTMEITIEAFGLEIRRRVRAF